MTVPDSLPLAILNALDAAILRRNEAGLYEVYGTLPAFYNRLFPPAGRTPCVSPWLHCETFNDFMTEAETFFANNNAGFLSSGLWREETGHGSYALEARALCFGQTKVIVLLLLNQSYVDRERVLQQAREELLERRLFRPHRPAPGQDSVVDSLSSLYVWEEFLRNLENEIEQVAAAGDLSILFLDIDDFRIINEVYGEKSGDSVIAGIGILLRNFLRQEDMAARFSGGKFAVLAPYTLQHQAVRMAEKLRAAIAEHSFSPLPPITVSIGCATYRKEEMLKDFISRTELALAEAKAGGKNMVRIR